VPHVIGETRPPRTRAVAQRGDHRRPACLIANLAVEVAPIRVNLIAAGFVDSPLSAGLLGDELDKRRAQLRATLPTGHVVEPADVAALAVGLSRLSLQHR
jgi:NAD(P)-dependent dehydrogenase (short-subunit alcohol dehydrogenase family)